LELCPTYQITSELSFSPVGRLEAAARIFEGGEIEGRLVETVYSCTKCAACEVLCPEGVKVTEVVHETRKELARLGKIPPGQERIVEGILNRGNAVGGDPARRLEWLPEDFEQRDSEVLLFVGCLPSYVVKEAASATYLLLKKLGVDFMILEDEGCCGLYPYEIGRTEVAAEIFAKNAERFKDLGVREIIVPCNGCLKCFKYYYTELLGPQDFTVKHVLEVVFEEIKGGSIPLQGAPQRLTFLDPCRLARGEGLVEEPRELLRSCGAELQEGERTGVEAPCCGAGAGVRSLYKDLSVEMATKALKGCPSEHVVTACPFCAFNLSYASRKRDLGKKISYFTSLVLASLPSGL